MSTSYTPPSIGSAGLIISTYNAVRDWLLQQFRSIFGAANYLGTDSADFQDIAIRALMASDTAQGIQAIYLSMNPLTAIGASLDQIGMLIGTRRKSATSSAAVVTLTGTPGTVITNGVVSDVNGNYWNLASPTTIGGGGTVNVIATSQVVGAITANIGAISTIATPTAGWISVTNAAAATPGVPVESDSMYRARLLISQALPSSTRLAGTAADVAAVEGVTRSIVYENQYGYTASYGICNTANTDMDSIPNDNVFELLTGYTLDSSMIGQTVTIDGVPFVIDSIVSPTEGTLTTPPGTQTGVSFFIGDGIALGPAHSITAVAEGGSSTDIAQAIYENKCPGCLTNGTTSVSVTDPNNPDIAIVISFDVLAYLPIYVALSIHPLTGYTSATQAAIASGITNYLNSLSIGEAVVYSELYGAALTARPNPDEPLFSIRSLASGGMLAETTGDLNGTINITVASGDGIVNGQVVTGAGIPAGATVVSIGGTALVISDAATATATGVDLQFFDPGTSDIPIQYDEAAQGLAVNVAITLV